jgi:hypothetical protein
MLLARSLVRGREESEKRKKVISALFGCGCERGFRWEKWLTEANRQTNSNLSTFFPSSVEHPTAAKKNPPKAIKMQY